MPYTAQFFAEKLNVPVEYFNPLRNVQIDPSVNLEELARVAHSLGEVVGLGLRNLANCPVEMNLMPESTLRWQAFNERKPYFMATVFSLVLVAFAVGYLYEKLAQAKEKEIEDLQPKVTAMQAKSDSFNRVYSKFQATQKDAAQITEWMEDRYYWGDVLAQLRNALLRSEADTEKKLSPEKPGVEAGIWIEQLSSDASLGTESAGNNYAPPMGMVPGGRMPGMPAAPEASGSAQPANGSVISIVCRAVNLTSVDPSANSEIAYAVENELKSSTNYFKPEGTQLTGQITPDDTGVTFSFGVTVTLQNPLKL